MNLLLQSIKQIISVLTSVAIISTPGISTVTPSQAPHLSPSEVVIINGERSLGNNQSIKYQFSLPKKGGILTGSISGSCNGNINGSAEPPINSKSSITGNIIGSCPQFGGSPFTVKLMATFNGSVDFQSSNLGINYNLTQPISNQGNLVLPFSTSSSNTSSPTSQQPQNTSSNPPGIQVAQDKVIFEGEMNMPDRDPEHYVVSVPRHGGQIVGSGAGLCQASVTGTVGNLDNSGKRPISGKISGTCKPIIQLNYRTTLSGTFWGSLDDANGVIEIIHNGIFEQNANSYLKVNYTSK